MSATLLSFLLMTVGFPWAFCSEPATRIVSSPQEESPSFRSSWDHHENNIHNVMPTMLTVAGNSTDYLNTSHTCFLLTSPTVGGVYQSSAALSIHWLYDQATVDAFKETVNATLTLSLAWVDNYANTASIIAENIDPASGVYLWDMPSSIRFNKRLYIVLKAHWQGLEETYQQDQDGSVHCNYDDQIAGPFTVTSNRVSRYFLITSPDPGSKEKNASSNNNLGYNTDALRKVPMGRLMPSVPTSITWYCNIPGIATIDLYLAPFPPHDSQDRVLIAQKVPVSDARFFYRIPSSHSQLFLGRSFRLLIYGHSSNRMNKTTVISWASDGPYTIED